jgi:hypothetical protein
MPEESEGESYEGGLGYVGNVNENELSHAQNLAKISKTSSSTFM